MSWIGRLFGSAAGEDVRSLRFAVVDVETTGLDPHTDRLLAIGAVVVDALRIRFDDAFHAHVRQSEASSTANILVHGIDGTTQKCGEPAADALSAFVRYAGDAPLVAFHADFDRLVIDRAVREALDARLGNRWIDLADLAPAVMPEHSALETLDEWTAALGIPNYRRHDALADALATAQLFQIALTRGAAAGDSGLSALARTAEAQRWLARRRF